jgi:hypothetical protein
LIAYEIPKAKDKENRRKHGMPLSSGDLVFEGLYFETIDFRRDYGELRLVAVGPAFGGGDRLLSVTYTWREQRRRFISVRQASGDESRRYHHRHS